MRQRISHKLKRALVFLLIFSMMTPIMTQMLEPMAVSAKVTQAEIDALKNSAKELAGQKKDLQKELAAVRADKNKLMDQKTLIEQQMNVVQSEINNLNAQIAYYDEMIVQKEADLVVAEAEEQAQYELFCERVRFMEEDGQDNYWSILFGSADFADMLDKFMTVEEIMEFDNGVMNNLIAIREQIIADKASLELSRQEQETAKVEQEAKKSELKGQQSEVDALIKDINSKEDELEAADAALKAAANAADAAIKKKEKELAAQIANVVSEAGYMWPLSTSYNVISSLYGPRKHPVTGKPGNHTGIDIPAPSGSSIFAAKSGVVVTSTYNSSYGNYVVVSHSDGTSTLYAHMSKRVASQGQTVKQGAVIGKVGTTGSSTGNHLHLEIRVNGTRKDPMNYYSLKLYMRYNGKLVPLN